ncbi:hypothetical protein DITRI_Ditri11bG0051400 [Diplodiscus trichospermus]
MRTSKNNTALIFTLLVGCILLSMTSSGSLLAEARIPNFSAIKGSLNTVPLHRRSLQKSAPVFLNSPRLNAPRGHG